MSDALTRAQTELIERMNTLTRDVAAIGVRIDQMAVVTNEQIRALVEQVKATTEVVARNAEQMRLLIDGVSRLQTEPGEGSGLTERPKVKEIAAWLRLSPNTIYAMCRSGQIPCKQAGRSYIFTKADLIEWSRSYPR